jgi:antirestriction protein
METPKIYVGTYYKYNSGSLFGKWIDLTDFDNIEDFYTACKKLHCNENDPEFMFQDHENIPDSFIGESWLSEKVFEYFQELQKIDNPEAFEVFVNNYSFDLNEEDITDIIEQFEESFQGEISESNFAYDMAKEMIGEQSEFILSYFDYDKFERDLFSSDYWSTDGFIFRNI